MAAVAVLDALRARIREIEHSSEGRLDVRSITTRIPSGDPAVDRLIGGLPRPGIVEIAGSAGTGRIQLAAAFGRAVQAEGAPIAWVDPAERIHPPGLALHGLHLDQLLIVRPAADREAWTIEQVCRSGAFPLVVMVDPRTLPRGGVGWRNAVEAGGCSLVVLTLQSRREISADVRLALRPSGPGLAELTVQRDRQGPPGRAAARTPAPAEASPW